MLLSEWQKFKGWTVLEFFLRENRKIHLKALSRELKISPRTAQTYLNLYAKEQILEREQVGNILLYSLAHNYLALEFKRLYFSILIRPHIIDLIQKNKDISSLILYGSHATGEYDAHSDVDMIALSQAKEINLGPVKVLENSLGKEVKIEVIKFSKWKELEGKGDSFYNSVMKDHILLFGAHI